MDQNAEEWGWSEREWQQEKKPKLLRASGMEEEVGQWPSYCRSSLKALPHLFACPMQ